ncbi:MAG: LysM peptidoglycan-binding domain-containing protein, partial [Proteobacteria bacterium]|nr:LysM peptidoglycan-binding domain-containing protein [Pseudomonadota bacterium]
NAIVHIVRQGETLASIAERYYGEPRFERVLVAENGLTTEGGSAIVVGLRLRIPTVSFHVVRPDETWADLARRYYGAARRAYVLVAANDAQVGRSPDTGAEIVVPYPVRHVARRGETLSQIAKLYYANPNRWGFLRRFNSGLRHSVARGQIVLVPLPTLVLSKTGRELVHKNAGATVLGGQVRAEQSITQGQLPRLGEHVRRGRYAEAVAMASRLLAEPHLTSGQFVQLQRELAVAYVALEREELAVAALRLALEREPGLTLDRVQTSPRVLEAFRKARTRRAQAGPVRQRKQSGVP